MFTQFHPDHASRQPTELARQIPIACIKKLRGLSPRVNYTNRAVLKYS